MRRLVVVNLISLAGCFAAPNGEIDVFIDAHDFMRRDALFLGRVIQGGDIAIFGIGSVVDQLSA